MADHPPSTDGNVKTPNLVDRVKEEIEAVLQREKSSHHHKETHGMRDDIDENTPVSEVKAPNVFERAKEEIEALVQTFNSKKESETEIHLPSDREMLYTEKSLHHHKETHGRRDDIDENTPASEVKAPNVFERAKEEIEALVQTFHSGKESQIHVPSDRETLHIEETRGMQGDTDENNTLAMNDVKAPNVFERAKEEIPAPASAEKDNEAKTPSLIEKAKEQIEAMMHPKKSPPHHHHHKETHGRSDDIDENTPIDEVKGPNLFQRAKEEIEALVQTIHPKKESGNLVSSPKEGGFRFS